MMPIGDRRAGDDFWDALEARALHPARMEIIEVLRWIEQPVYTADLLHIFNWKRVAGRVEHHLRQLTKLGVVERSGGDRTIQAHRLAERLRR